MELFSKITIPTFLYPDYLYPNLKKKMGMCSLILPHSYPAVTTLVNTTISTHLRQGILTEIMISSTPTCFQKQWNHRSFNKLRIGFRLSILVRGILVSLLGVENYRRCRENDLQKTLLRPRWFIYFKFYQLKRPSTLKNTITRKNLIRTLLKI